MVRFGWLGLLFCALLRAQVITTVAGTTFTFPSQPLAALNAPLGKVGGVAVDGKGNVFVADQDNHIIVQITTGGTLSVVAGNGLRGFSGDGGPATSASLDSPYGVAVDASGNLYIADFNNLRVRMVSAGIITTVAGGGPGGDGGPATNASLSQPAGLAVDSSGNLYIADSGNGRIRKVSGGTITTIAGGGSELGDGVPATSASLIFPYGVAVGPGGEVYLSDPGHGRIRKVAGGSITTVAGKGAAGSSGDGGPALNATFDSPTGVAVDPNGNLYIADTHNSVIRKVSNGVITTFAGNRIAKFAGDGGLATSASLGQPETVALDAAGVVYIGDTGNRRLRTVALNGIIATRVGNGAFRSTGDGGPATSATLDTPFGLTLATNGTMYVADVTAHRVRRITGGIISGLAGNGTPGYSGDGGSAATASLAEPRGVAADSAGNVYIADYGNNVVRRVSAGTITTFAGNGQRGSCRDGVAATNTSLTPADVAVDAAGNVFVADLLCSAIRKISGGVITTVAGNGTFAFSGDGGPATSASLSFPFGVAVDSQGNLFIADGGNNRIRKVTGTVITTVAGTGDAGFSGDGGAAVSSLLFQPNKIVVDAAGIFYFSEVSGSRVRKVANGILTTVAGSLVDDFFGDGGPAVNAALNSPAGLALDAVGNLFIADSQNHRIREVLAAPPVLTIAPRTLTFSAPPGTVPAAAQTITLTSSIPGLVYSAAANVPWLTITPIDGTSPASLQVIADPTQLSAGTSSGIITITAPAAVPPVQQVAVTFQIGAATPGRLGLSSTGLSFSLSPRASPATKLVTALNLGSGSIRFSATATTASGGSWLSVTPNSGTTSPASPASLTITATPGSLALGTYSGSITVSSADTGQQISITVTLAITGPPQKILLSQVGFAFTAVAQGAPALPQQLGILNAGAGTLNYTVQATTRPGASGWLKVSATSGTVNRPLLDVLFVDVIVDASSLAPGAYYGQVQVVAAGASNSPQSALVVLTVLPSGQNPGPDVRPTGLVFTGIAGANPGSQIVTVANVTASPIAFGSSIAYVGAGGWIQYKPTDATVNPGAPVSVVVQPDFSTLSVGPHRAALTLAFDDGSFQVVSILAVVASAGGGTSTGRKPGDRFDSSCIPTKLLPQFTQVGFGGAPGVGFPVAVVTKIVDDCGSPLTGGSVTASFDNGDLPLGLVSLQDGTWTQTWQPHYATNTVTITVDARQGNLSGQTRSAGLSLQTRQPPPLLSGGPLSATTLSEGPLAPGDLILIRGSGLASGQAAATSAPLGQLLAGASVVIGGSLATLLYADATQIVGVVPPDVPVNTEQQLILQRDNTAGVPISLIIATTHPAVLSKDGSGRGQALAYKSTGSASLLADSANPVSAGDSLILYCSGLGATSTSGVVTNLPVVTIGGLPAPVTYAGVALPANYPASGAPTVVGGLAAPGFGGLYQITATVPSGLATGQGEVLVSSAGQASFSGVTIAVTGSGTPGAPVITSVGTVGGFAGIAQNTWVEIKGINLAPSIVGAGMTWEKAPEFASNRMPTQLGGVSVAINGKSAFVYFISPTQLNVLTPLDDTIGPVQITVTNGGSSSPVFSATLRAAAPSFPLFGATRYIAAAHADGRLLVGPTSLSAPGFPFLPAQPGEAITIYAYGLGLPATTLVNGSASQSGELPAKPPIQIGGLTAEVSFAGLIGPGLYQINLVVPAAAPNGDNSVTCSYAGQTSPAGDLLLVQR